jgi:hypothetical protein
MASTAKQPANSPIRCSSANFLPYPYGVLPASIYADTEYLHVPESRMESYK